VFLSRLEERKGGYSREGKRRAKENEEDQPIRDEPVRAPAVRVEHAARDAIGRNDGVKAENYKHPTLHGARPNTGAQAGRAEVVQYATETKSRPCLEQPG